MTPEKFQRLISQVTQSIFGRTLDKQLETDLNRCFPPSSDLFNQIAGACHSAIEAGWMCNREAAGIKYGRVIKSGPQTHGFSVDVVEMADIEGPYHRHPNGEIDLIMPMSGTAKFDGHSAGWLVYGANSAHRPTVQDGRALVLYLLPEGAIEFTGA